ncbi:DUF6678 family protein [Pseudoduganella violaceinigra]|uniref:DUF6678 family protein n=1 Tax=Pseudoduganella violaceinigra TaxID=246602 RepID=UPI003530E1B5
MLDWESVVAAIHELRLESRLKELGGESLERWSPSLIVPVPGYLECSGGPIPFRAIEYLMVKRLRTTARGRLVAPLVEDLTAQLCRALDTAGANYCIEPEAICISARH